MSGGEPQRSPRAQGRPSVQEPDGWSEGPPLPRWVLWLMLPGIVGPLLIFGFIVVTHRAHDEARCPYHEITQRSLGSGAIVREEARSCLAGVEEHRYSLLRGAQRQVLGTRRFDAEAFAPAAYRWSARVTPQGEVQVVVHNPGHDDVLFREGTAEEHAKGISERHVPAPPPAAGTAGVRAP